MYFKYDPEQVISVEKPYRRAIVPFMMADNAACPVDFSVHITEWVPGSQVDEHTHEDAMEVMFCISGHGVASVEDQVYDFCPDSMIAAAPGQRHCIKNTGDTPLRAVCIFSPAVTAEDLRRRAQSAVDQWNLSHPE